MRYDIWRDGYCVTGQQGKAAYIGWGDGSNFQEACQNWAQKFPDKAKSLSFNKECTAAWGCRLFPSEAEARKNFG